MKRLCAFLCISLLAMPFVACDDEDDSNTENNQDTGNNENNDPPKPGEETNPGDKVAALEKRIREMYRLQAFSFDDALDGDKVSILYDADGSGSGIIMVNPADYSDNSIGDHAAIGAAIKKYLGDEFTYVSYWDEHSFTASRQVRRIHYNRGNDNEESRVFEDQLNLSPLTMSFSSQFAYSGNAKWTEYLAMKLPYSLVNELAVLDDVAPGRYTASDGELKLDVFENGDVALDIGARIFIGVGENTYYDLHVGHVSEDEITDYFAYHYTDRVDYYGQIAMEIAWRLNGEELIPAGTAYANHEDYLAAKSYSLLDWGVVKYEEISDPSKYALEGINFYKPGWISDAPYQPAPLHDSRKVQYIPKNIADKIVRTQIERSNSIYDDDIGAQYTVYKRTIWLDPERVTAADFDDILAAIQAQGITESANKTEDDYRRWAGAIQVSTDGEDYYELVWDFDAGNLDKRMFKLTIEYWYDTWDV